MTSSSDALTIGQAYAAPTTSTRSETIAALSYRADIDGLRAVAVLSVVLFHAGVVALSGGYIGVDLFFVISGYLITSILRKEIVNQTFSMSTFYVRRIRRIIPALLAVMSLTSVAAFFFLLPSELEDYARSGFAALGGVSNIFFWSTSDYFAVHATTQPLLHTWSLAMEEQYYMLLPLLLFAMRRRSLQFWMIAIGTMSLVSLVTSVITVAIDSNSAFYLPYARAWELLLGSYLAIVPLIWRPAVWLRQVIAVVATLCIAAPIFLYGRSTPFPGLAALPPCLGVAALIWVGGCGGSWVTRGLSSPPAVFIGKISYSLYLVHWPLVVFQQSNAVLLANGSLQLVKIVLVVASIVAAITCWWFVERPFRWPDLFPTDRLLTWVALWTGALLLVLASFFVSKGWPDRYPQQARDMAAWLSYDADPIYRGGQCFIASRHRLADFDRETCLILQPGKQNDLLVGDSHAAQLWHGLSATLPDHHVLQATASGCRPVLNRRANAKSACDAIMGYVFGDFLEHNKPRRVIIAARWRPEDVASVVETLRWTRARGLETVLVGPIVEYDAPLPRLIARGLTEGQPDLPVSHRVAEAAELDKTLEEVARREGASYLSPYRALCSAERCVQTLSDGSPVQFDYGHLTQAGSEYVARKLEAQGALR